MLTVIAPIILYTAIVFGMYLFHSGWIAILGYHMGMIFFLLVARDGKVLKKLFSGFNIRAAFINVLLGSLGGVLIYFLWPYIRLPDLTMRSGLEAVGLKGYLWLGFAVYFSIVNPWLEELFWRGYYATSVRHQILSDILFAGYHVFVLVLFVNWIWALLAFVVLAVTGTMWRRLSDRLGGLAVPALAHFFANLSIIAVVFARC